MWRFFQYIENVCFTIKEVVLSEENKKKWYKNDKKNSIYIY